MMRCLFILLMLAVTLGVIGTTIVSRIPVLGQLVVIAMILMGIIGLKLTSGKP